MTTTSTSTPTLTHWVGGQPRPGTSERHSDVTNPATGAVTAQLPLATSDEKSAAVATAKAAFPGWRDT
jgi:malonate-semialdehyde dehydrogenase (acetylating)/methylmalonate-semialdehyde dehydrogenase